MARVDGNKISIQLKKRIVSYREKDTVNENQIVSYREKDTVNENQ